MDEAGRTFGLALEETVVEERNPLRLVLRARGRLVDPSGERFLAVEARLTFLARLSAIRIVLTFTNDLPPLRVLVDRLRFSVALADSAARIGGLGSYQGHEPRLHTQEPLVERIWTWCSPATVQAVHETFAAKGIPWMAVTNAFAPEQAEELKARLGRPAWSRMPGFTLA